LSNKTRGFAEIVNQRGISEVSLAQPAFDDLEPEFSVYLMQRLFDVNQVVTSKIQYGNLYIAW
jgi:hypothetical protein